MNGQAPTTFLELDRAVGTGKFSSKRTMNHEREATFGSTRTDRFIVKWIAQQLWGVVKHLDTLD